MVLNEAMVHKLNAAKIILGEIITEATANDQNESKQIKRIISIYDRITNEVNNNRVQIARGMKES